MAENLKFEEALVVLDELVKKLENGNADLDESLKCYEEAIRLVGVCNEHLFDAEKRVKILTEQLDGSVTERDFSENKDEA